MWMWMCDVEHTWRHSWLWSWEGTLAFGPSRVGAFESHVQHGCDIWEGVETSKRLSRKFRLHLGGWLGIMAQRELWGGALSHWGLLLFVVDPAVTECAGLSFSDGCSMLVASKGVSVLSLFKENREFKKPAWFEPRLQGVCNSHRFSVVPTTKISVSLL